MESNSTTERNIAHTSTSSVLSARPYVQRYSDPQVFDIANNTADNNPMMNRHSHQAQISSPLKLNNQSQINDDTNFALNENLGRSELDYGNPQNFYLDPTERVSNTVRLSTSQSLEGNEPLPKDFKKPIVNRNEVTVEIQKIYPETFTAINGCRYRKMDVIVLTDKIDTMRIFFFYDKYMGIIGKFRENRVYKIKNPKIMGGSSNYDWTYSSSCEEMAEKQGLHSGFNGRPSTNPTETEIIMSKLQSQMSQAWESGKITGKLIERKDTLRAPREMDRVLRYCGCMEKDSRYDCTCMYEVTIEETVDGKKITKTGPLPAKEWYRMVAKSFDEPRDVYERIEKRIRRDDWRTQSQRFFH